MALRARRRGAAAVEFAITAPIAFLLLLASVEFCRANMIRHTVDNAAYEGARAGLVPGATATEAQTVALQSLSALGIHGATVVITPSELAANTPQVTVDVTVPYSSNTYGAAVFLKNKSLHSSMTLTRENVDL